MFPEPADFKSVPPGELTYTIVFTPDGFSMSKVTGDNLAGKKVAEGYLCDDLLPGEMYLGKESDLEELYMFGMGSTLAVFKDNTAEVVWRGSGVPIMSVLFGTLQ